MQSLFDANDRDEILRRIAALEPGATRLWGTMSPSQMLAHLSIAMEDAAGERPLKQAFLGKLVTPLIRGLVFGEKPFGRNGPTDPNYVVSDPRDFEKERARLTSAIARIAQGGRDAASGRVHPFFGTLSGDEWGRLTWKHADHHLRQFGG